MIMKKLTVEEQAHVMGGYDEEGCFYVQTLAAEQFKREQEGFQVNPDWWDWWGTLFDEFCM